MQKNKTIKKISGEILIYLYAIQRCDYGKLDIQNFDFYYGGDHGIYLSNKEKHKSELATKYKDIDLFNALKYLQQKEFVRFAGNGQTNMGESFIVLEVTDLGIDIVEGVEKEIGKDKFQIVFNFELNLQSLLKIENNFDIDSLIKASVL